MFGSEILEVAIGLVFVFLIASLVATTVREAIEGVLKTRAIHLERGIRQLLDDPSGTGATQQVFDHPLLFGLFAGQYDPNDLTTFWVKWRRGGQAGATLSAVSAFFRNLMPRAGGAPPPAGAQGAGDAPKRLPFFTDLPAYIPSRNFALALMHVVAGTGSGGSGEGVLTLKSVEANTMLLPEGRLKQAMLVALGEAKGDLDRARTSLEAWFDGTMDRVSGWYKRETQWILFGIGLTTAVALNVDSLNIARNLASNNTLRQSLIARVDATYPNIKRDTPPSVSDLNKEVEGLSDVIGYPALKKAFEADPQRVKERKALGASADTNATLTTEDAKKAYVESHMSSGWPLYLSYWFSSMPGWLLSALAISLGAPFWFDLLNKLMIIRSTIKPYEKSPAEPSADRGAAASPAQQPLAPAPQAAPADGGGQPPAGGPPLAGGPPAPAQLAPAAAPPTEVSLRVAFEGADEGTITCTRDGIELHVPDNGFLELALQTDVAHQVSAQGTRNGQSVIWAPQQPIIVRREDEGKPLLATLV
jgi:hypothetical protein